MDRKQLARAAQFLAAFAASFLLCAVVTGLYIQQKSRMEYAQMEQVVLTRATKVNNVITRLLYKTQTLSALVIQNNGQIEDFERVAATILDDPAIQNVILAPGGIVTNVYPVEGNEQVLGLDYFSEGEGNLEAVQARDSGQLVLGGPFHLVQGGQALVGRLPVYVKDADGASHFWGLVSVTLHYPEALEGAELDQLQQQGFAFEIWRINPDDGQRQIIANSSYDYNPNARYVEKPLNLLNAEWYFRISPIQNWYEFPETWIFLCAGVLVSLLIASLVLHNSDLRQMRDTLEGLSNADPLTGALNRRGILGAVEELSAGAGTPFLLCYLDLNRFKNINDTFGHIAGDRILSLVARTFLYRMGPQDLFGRIGGDEFVLICRGDDGAERLPALLEAARGDLARSFPPALPEPMEVTFSIGQAAYPADGRTADELLAHADAAMYREKLSIRCGGEAAPQK